jgi:hypothetical protein
MIGLLATYYIVAYLLVPSGLFRFFYSLFLPRVMQLRFQRTRAEEFAFAISASVLPFLLALGLVWTVATWPFDVHGSSSAERREAYRTLIGTAISEKTFGEGGRTRSFWAATNQVTRRQARFLIWYYISVLLEAWTFAWLIRNYGLWNANLAGLRRRVYLCTANNLLLPALSEWPVLLTPFIYPPNPRREVWLDVLTTLDVLYKGRVLDYFLNKEGELSGVFLEYPRRFDRQGFLRDIDKGVAKSDTDSYWRNIPSNNLYIPSDKIVNLNVRYLTETEAMALRTSWHLLEEGLDVEAGQ